jgi:predicted DNA-binding transcriptional regulator YafY
MATTKHPLGRYLIIDRELGQRDFVKTKDLCKIINHDLGFKVSKRMINDDLRAMRDDDILGYKAPIAYNNSEQAYYYSERDYTIRAYGLRKDDINALAFYANTINQYRDYDIFKDFTNAIDKVLEAVDIRKGISADIPEKTVVLTENFQKFTGATWIPSIIGAIDSSSVIEIEYPYILKEDRHRWYLVAMYKSRITTFGLDRIMSFKKLDKNFIPNDFDSTEYFRYSFGITVDGETEEIILSFTPHQGNYIKALSIHTTQKILLDTESEFRISLQVKPSYEFYEKILGYGENVKILSPEHIVNVFKAKLKGISDRYKN